MDLTCAQQVQLRVKRWKRHYIQLRLAAFSPARNEEEARLHIQSKPSLLAS